MTNPLEAGIHKELGQGEPGQIYLAKMLADIKDLEGVEPEIFGHPPKYAQTPGQLIDWFNQGEGNWERTSDRYNIGMQRPGPDGFRAYISLGGGQIVIETEERSGLSSKERTFDRLTYFQKCPPYGKEDGLKLVWQRIRYSKKDNPEAGEQNPEEQEEKYYLPKMISSVTWTK